MKACKVITTGFAIAYMVSLALFVIGLLGLFGQPKDPLAAVFVLLLGMPWTLLLDGAPEIVRPFLGLLTPAVNLAILYIVCRSLQRRQEKGRPST
jgi:hypothetical protein